MNSGVPERDVARDLLVAVEQPEEQRRRRALRELCLAVDLDVLSREAERLLLEVDTSFRRRMVALLGMAPPSSIWFGLLQRSLRDPSWTVREAAVTALASYAPSKDGLSEEFLDAVVTCTVADRSPLVRTAAIRALQREATPGAVRLSGARMIAEHLADRRPPRRCRAVTALSHFPEHASLFAAEMARLLDDSHYRVRRAAAEAFAQSPDGSLVALPALVRRRFDGETSVASAAQRALLAPPSAPLEVQTDARIVAEIGQAEQALATLLQAEEEAAVQACEQLRRRRLTWRAKIGEGQWTGADTIWLLGKMFEQKVSRVG